jgi:hypothetical protein
VFLSQKAFHLFEDQLRSRDVEEQKRNKIRDAEAEAGLDPRGMIDPYAPYRSPAEEQDPGWAGYNSDNMNGSTQALPLVANASPFQRAGLYNNDPSDYDENKSLRSEDHYDGTRGSRFTSNRDDSVSNFGSESYAPSRNMFQNTDKRGLADKEAALAGEIVGDNETTEVLKESAARRRWVALCWILTWWIPTPFLTHIGRMKRMDVRQAWREKLALNLLIWFICGCAVFVIAVLGNVICPTEHVYNQSELEGHSVQNAPNNVFTAIRGEVFDLTQVATTHQRVVPVVPQKMILKYGGLVADNIFPVQVCFFFLLSPIRCDVDDDDYRSARCAMVLMGLYRRMLSSTLRTTRIRMRNTTISECSRTIRDRIGISNRWSRCGILRVSGSLGIHLVKSNRWLPLDPPSRYTMDSSTISQHTSLPLLLSVHLQACKLLLPTRISWTTTSLICSNNTPGRISRNNSINLMSILRFWIGRGCV